jgi:hypothetical protein
VLEAEIVSAVASGITVIFACGNGGSVGWPGCLADVISVGGAFPRQDGTWEASSYASSGVSSYCPGRHCPDLSGIVGQAPKGIFIVMPTMMGAAFDQSFSGGVHPNGDETGPNDGWLVASGTSSAAPMVAGAAALMLQAKSSLSPAEIKQALMDTCIDVVNGASASGEVAGIGPDSATGAGMINIGAAVNKVAPAQICPTAPFQCYRIPLCRPAPVIQCKPAPIEPICRPAPAIECLRAPVCRTAPVACLRAPMECLRAPFTCGIAPVIECLRAPVEIACPPAPTMGCQAGPWKRPDEPVQPPLEPVIRPRRLVPVVVMVAEEELDVWMAQEHAYAAQAMMGMASEYAGFPETEGCRRGPFDPGVR